MNIDIRKTVKNNFVDLDIKEIKKSIEDAIKDGDEITLPGLGVFFEIIWSNCDLEIKKNLLNILKNNIK